MRYQCTLLTFQCKKGKALNLKKIVVQQFSSKELALGTVYNEHHISYCREKDGSIICCNFQFGWEPTSVTFIHVTNVPKGGFYLGFDMTDKHQRRRINTLLEELITINRNRDYGAQDSSFPDNSLKMSDWHWQLSMPKGYRLLKPGEVILETDMEYGSRSSNNHWSSVVSWYNVGKVVEKGQSWAHVGKNGETVSSGEGEPSPLICRKVN